MAALNRFRALLPPEIGIALELSLDSPLMRADAQRLQDALLSACLVAWQSMAGQPMQLVVEVKEVLLDEVVLDPDAEKLQGGLPPRAYVWLVISNSLRTPPGASHRLMPPPPQSDTRPASARRMHLTEVRDIVARHLGTMTVSTEVGRGTAFEMFLPTAMPLETLVVSASGSGVKHIFYVDDYDAMRELVSETLPDAGFQVSCFESGKDVMAALHANPLACDAIVSDYRLQGFSGIELLRQVKVLRPELPVVIISGYVDAALESSAHDAGAALVVSKTADLSGLCTALRGLLGGVQETPDASYSEWAKL